MSSSSQAGSSSSEPESSSSTTFVRSIDAALPGFRIAIEGRVLHVTAPAPGTKAVRVFDMQGHVLASATFAGASYRLDLGALAHGSPLVVRLESAGRSAGYFKVAPAAR